MNLALGALAVALAAAVVGVLFVGTNDPSASEAAPVLSQTTTGPSESAGSTTVSTDGSQTVVAPPTSTTVAFVMPEALNGRWRSEDGVTIAQFSPGAIESLQSVLEIDGQSVSLALVEPSRLGAVPTNVQPIQAVLRLTTESDTTLSAPQAVLVEFLATDEGLRLIFEVGGTMVEEHLRPTS